MKKVKMSSEESRAWRVNQTKLVDKDGVVVRDVNPVEVDVLKQLDQRAVVTRKMETAIIDEGTETESKIQVTPVPVAPGVAALKRTINGHAIEEDRDLIKKAFLMKHGTCQAISMTGQMKFRVRDPRDVPPPRTMAGNMSNTPQPDTCPTCSKYAGRQPGRHHFICQYNNVAPPEERGDRDGTVITQQAAPAGSVVPPQPTVPRVKFLPSVATAETEGPPVPINGSKPVPPPSAVPAFLRGPEKTVIDTTGAAPVAAAPAKPSVYSPLDCPNTCTKYAGYLGDGKHHHMCTWKAAWEATQSGAEPTFLVNAKTGDILREASPEEIVEASQNLRICKVGGEEYGVLTKSELEQEPVEAAAAP
jgi:hypothetical protein